MSSQDFEDAFEANPPPDGTGGRRRPPKVNPAKLVAWLGIGALLLIVLLVFASGQGGIVEVGDTQVAVIVNYFGGEPEMVLQPGYKVFVPFVKQAFLFDKSPQKFMMEGERNVSANHVSKLTVRANDGSNFWFDEVEIQYELIPEQVPLVLADSGSGESFKVNWVRAYARSILRDEFGKFTASDIANPTIYKTATSIAKDRLNEVLNPHGARIIQIITPKPKFDAAYERSIEDRKVADQETERLQARALQLERERERRLAQIDATKAVEYEALKGTLEAERIEAERNLVRVEKSADAYAMQIVAGGEAKKSQLTEQARGMTAKATKEAEGLKAIIEALEKRGEVLVREKLAERLGEIEFTLVPYTRDAAPERVELLGAGGESLAGLKGGNR